jgi:hypothetical protein
MTGAGGGSSGGCPARKEGALCVHVCLQSQERWLQHFPARQLAEQHLAASASAEPVHSCTREVDQVSHRAVGGLTYMWNGPMGACGCTECVCPCTMATSLFSLLGFTAVWNVFSIPHGQRLPKHCGVPQAGQEHQFTLQSCSCKARPGPEALSMGFVFREERLQWCFCTDSSCQHSAERRKSMLRSDMAPPWQPQALLKAMLAAYSSLCEGAGYRQSTMLEQGLTRTRVQGRQQAHKASLDSAVAPQSSGIGPSQVQPQPFGGRSPCKARLRSQLLLHTTSAHQQREPSGHVRARPAQVA